MSEKSYVDYYNNTIKNNKTGFKLVLGGTGLGKTSSIIDVISQNEDKSRKFIYIANRLQLLNEMEDKLKEEKIGYAYLKSDTDVVLDIVTNPKKRAELYQFIEESFVQPYLEKGLSGASNFALDIGRVYQACNYIERLGNTINQLRRSVRDELVNRQIRDVINFMRSLLQKISASNPQLHKELLEKSIIKDLFPYIAFTHDEDTSVLLVTIQKAYRGFFDGATNINLTKLNGRNGKRVIFLDEFDFLENELLSLICQSEQIDRPFRFVEFFYRAMADHKLPLEAYPALANSEIADDLKRRLKEITLLIATLRGEGIDFPNINQFTSQLEEKRGVIFQTSRTLIQDRLYLKQTERSFEIVKEFEKDITFHAIRLFGAIQSATTLILFLFKELESTFPTIYQEILRQCYQDTDYYRLIGRITQLPRQHHEQQTRFDNLIEEGFGLYEIRELGQETDPDEVEFRFLSIYTTPERILSGLARHNLVFGLSATADIPRLVRNFNLDWLRKQKGVNYIEVTPEDVEIIQHLNTEKQTQNRKNSVEVLPAKTLDDFAREDIRAFINGVSRDPEFGGDTPFHKGRVERFFATLCYIVENHSIPEDLKTDTHLLFFNTFRQIKHVFKSHKRWKESESLFKIKRIDQDDLFDVYQLEFEEISFITVFYDAEQARFIRNSDEVKSAYEKLFWKGLPVLVITQYPSAGNGVNLQYFPDEASKEKEIEVDFRNIHLLEAPYFYFGRWEHDKPIVENFAVLKQNLWYMAKLYEGQVITRQEFEEILAHLHTTNLNEKYHQNALTRGDATLNQVATFIQALGRIERVWHPMKDQTVTMSRDVWNIFELFCTRPQYESVLQDKLKTTSSNLSSIIEQIKAQAVINERTIRRYKDERLKAKNKKCIERVGKLLRRLEALRQGEDEQEARKHWTRLRETALRQDLHHKLLKEYACTFKAEPEHYKNGKVYINSEMELLPHHTAYGEDVRVWHLDSIYQIIRDNSVLRTFFERNEYELGFNNVTQKFYTPYFYQAVLVGAIGEVAIGRILASNGIPVTDDIPDSLFELADLKVEGVPIYIDCKNYSEQTLENFPLTPDNPAWKPKLNEQDFINLAKKKFEKIQQFHVGDEHTKLVFLNLASSVDWKRVYLDYAFNPVKSFSEAQIIVISGVLNRDKPNEYTEQFKKFLEHISA